MELYKGRPENIQGRLDKEIRVYDLLDSLGIEYERTDHERTDTMEACNEIDAILQVTICKNLFLCNRQKTNFYLLMMPGINHSRQRSCPARSTVQDCLLHHRKIWRDCWILHRVQ